MYGFSILEKGSSDMRDKKRTNVPSPAPYFAWDALVNILKSCINHINIYFEEIYLGVI